MQRQTSRRIRSTATAGGLLALALVAPAFVAAPAMAVTGLVRVSTTSGPSSSAKTQNTPCPAGKTVIGGGGLVTRGAGQVGMDIMLPLPEGSAFSVTGREDEDGSSANWSITSTVLCAPAPAGFEVVSGSTAFTSPDSNWHTVSCPFGKVALGVGGAVVGPGNSEVVLEDLRIDTSSVTVGGAEDGTGFAGTWQIQARAMCADQPAGYERLLTDSAHDSTSSKSATVSCSPGKQVHGVGAEILGGDGEVRLTAAHATSTTSVTAAAIEDQDGFGSSWKVRVFAICAN